MQGMRWFAFIWLALIYKPYFHILFFFFLYLTLKTSPFNTSASTFGNIWITYLICFLPHQLVSFKQLTRSIKRREKPKQEPY